MGTYEYHSETTFPVNLTLGFTIFNALVGLISIIFENYYRNIHSAIFAMSGSNAIPAIVGNAVVIIFIPLVIFRLGGSKMRRYEFDTTDD
jgi:hypothetical protein